MRKKLKTGTELLNLVEETLGALLPDNWSISYDTKVRSRPDVTDAVIKLRAPDRRVSRIVVVVRTSLEPREVGRVVDNASSKGIGLVLVAAPFLSPRTRELLEEKGAAYIDATGNVRLVLDRPALFLSTAGEMNNPWREERPLMSLKGPSSSRVVRALCDFEPPYGVRELADKAGSSLGSTSRVVSFLEGEAIVSREAHGSITGVDWQALIRRWTQDYGFETSNHVRTFLNPRTQADLMKRLSRLKSVYAVTGSQAAALVATVASVRLTSIFAADVSQVAEELGLREIDSGANVVLAEPFEPVVFERTWKRERVVYASLSQVAADLLTGPGRSPAEADALIGWMKEHEDEWRT